MLVYLVTGQSCAFEENSVHRLPARYCLTPIKALREMYKLSTDALDALEQLYTYGLRGDHLRNWHGKTNEDSFSLFHKSALTFLIKKQGLSVEEAMQQITGISDDDACTLKQTSHFSRI